jgi:hypothetical protein
MMKAVLVTIPQDTYINIKHYCVDANIPVTEVFRDAVREWCIKNNVQNTKSKPINT